MSRILPLKEIPSSSTLPGGRYRLVIDKLESLMSSSTEGRTSKLMYKITAKVVEPETQRNQTYFEQFCIGTNDDAEAEDLVTWKKSIGAKQFKRLVNALGVPYGDEEDEDTFLVACQGAEFVAAIIEKVEPKTITNKATGQETENPYAGNIRNESKGFWKIGEKTPGLDEDTTPTAPKKRTKPVGVAAPAGRPAPSDTMTCAGCREQVKRTDMPSHVEKHLADEKEQRVAELTGENAETPTDALE